MLACSGYVDERWLTKGVGDGCMSSKWFLACTAVVGVLVCRGVRLHSSDEYVSLWWVSACPLVVFTLIRWPWSTGHYKTTIRSSIYTCYWCVSLLWVGAGNDGGVKLSW